MDHSLSSYKITGQRVHPEDASKLLSGSEIFGPLFLECRNYFRVPRTCKGMTCAFSLKHQKGIWRYGIVYRVLTDFQVMELFSWKGPLSEQKENQQDMDKKVLYPAFYFHEISKLIQEDKTSSDIEWNRHFSRLTIDMDNFYDFRFVNQVRGAMPKHWSVMKCDLTNP